MAEFIGSRISLISKSDIRYVGTLHEINSENSTVALEQVVSFGTEGRRPDDEVAASDYVYAYIVFRGSDVKDLRIEENPKKDTLPKQPVPDDPAILGSTRRNTSPLVSPSSVQKPMQAQVQQPQQSQFPQQPQPSQPQQPIHSQQRQQPPPRYPQQPFPFYYPPPPQQRFGPQGFPASSGFPGLPYGAPPPGWYPPPGQGYHYPPPGQYYPPQPPIGSTAQQQVPPVAQGPQSQQHTTAGTGASAVIDTKEQKPKAEQEDLEKPVATVKLPSTSTTPAPPSITQRDPPTPPTESKPDVAAALAPPAITTSKDETSVTKSTPTTSIPTGTIPTGPKSGRIVPAIPRLSPATKPPVPVNGIVQSKPKPKPKNTTNENVKPDAKPAYTHIIQMAQKSLEDANRDARAAVEAAMAKLPPPPGQKKQGDESVIDYLTNKVSGMKTNDNIRTSKQPGTGGYAAGYRSGRGAHRGGRFQGDQQKNKVEVPMTDYDFASANAKFNKQDLVKEAIATGSAIGSPVEGSNTKENSVGSPVNGVRNGSQSSIISQSVSSYNKTSSFFDNISSESKDRDDAGSKRLGGREFRSEEQKKNLETFGQGSVDNGYRGGPGYRGRRGRGYGRTRGGYARGGRGSTRGSGAVTAES